MLTAEVDVRRAVVVVMLIGIGFPVSAVAQSRPADEIVTFPYVRVGAGVAFGVDPQLAKAVAFGFRGETERLAFDVSFFNYAFGHEPFDRELIVGSWVKLEALRFRSPGADRSAYLGGGLSWGAASAAREPSGDANVSVSGWRGDGLQAELTGGYELARTSNVRLFVQADASIPLFGVYSETDVYPRPPSGSRTLVATDRRYLPSLVVSVGLGWRTRRW